MTRRTPIENPFSTRFVRPGTLPFLFPPGESLDALVERLDRQRLGEILGPHGVGKSTLLAAISDALEVRGRAVVRLRQASPKEIWRATGQADSGSVLLIDGAETLSRFLRWRMRRRATRRDLRIVATVHQAGGWPCLYSLRPGAGTVVRVVDHLLDGDWSLISRADVLQCFAEHGDVRETLFALYDLYEVRARDAGRVLPVAGNVSAS